MREAETGEVRFRMGSGEATQEALTALRDLIAAHPGTARTRVVLATAEDTEVLVGLPEDCRVRPSSAMLEACELAFGRRIAAFRTSRPGSA